MPASYPEPPLSFAIDARGEQPEQKRRRRARHRRAAGSARHAHTMSTRSARFNRARTQPVLLGHRDDAEHRPPVRLRLLRTTGRPLPTLRSRPRLLLQGLRRDGAPQVATPRRTALPEQPPGPSQACAASAALSRTPKTPRDGEPHSRAESDASLFDPRTSPHCCVRDAGWASWNATVRPGVADRDPPLPSVRPVLWAGRPHIGAAGAVAPPGRRMTVATGGEMRSPTAQPRHVSGSLCPATNSMPASRPQSRPGRKEPCRRSR